MKKNKNKDTDNVTDALPYTTAFGHSVYGLDGVPARRDTDKPVIGSGWYQLWSETELRKLAQHQAELAIRDSDLEKRDAKIAKENLAMEYWNCRAQGFLLAVFVIALVCEALR
jgi:hypothetical protein